MLLLLLLLLLRPIQWWLHLLLEQDPLPKVDQAVHHVSLKSYFQSLQRNMYNCNDSPFKIEVVVRGYIYNEIGVEVIGGSNIR